jgi:uncharacterized protein YhbP (UPF0306 family)
MYRGFCYDEDMNVDVEQIVREYIDKSLHMSLATVSGDAPWVCEVHFVYDDELNLYWRSLPSCRHSQEIAANPKVAGNIVKQHGLSDFPYGIYFEGTAESVEDREDRERVFPLFQKRLNASEDILEDAESDDGHKFYKITVINWYAFGKFDGESGQKYKLEWNGGEK